MGGPVPAVYKHSDEHLGEILDNLVSFPFLWRFWKTRTQGALSMLYLYIKYMELLSSQLGNKFVFWNEIVNLSTRVSLNSLVLWKLGI